MLKQLFVIGIITFLSFALKAQYIAEVLEYNPAPGQFVNAHPWGTPSSTHSIIGGVNGTLTLGGFGGYVIFRFENPIENHPDNPFGMDFTIFGNATTNASEPGIVYVMKDENQNNLPDDTWYQLAASDYFFSSTKTDYEITYTNPNGSYHVPWNDNYGNSGVIMANSFHNQNYYPLQDSFPNIPSDEYTLHGTLVAHVVDSTNPSMIKTYTKSFGYADNRTRGSEPYTLPDNPYTDEKENAGGDAFDLDWAVDESGNYVALDAIDFVKVQNGVNGDAGWLGELSTEITGAADVAPDASITGTNTVFVVKKLAPISTENQIQLEAAYFQGARFQPNEPISYAVIKGNASIDENNRLLIESSGEITLEAWPTNEPELKDSLFTYADITSKITTNKQRNEIEIWPNPANNLLNICGNQSSLIRITHITGRTVFNANNHSKSIDISNLHPGVYFLHTELQTVPFIKK